VINDWFDMNSRRSAMNSSVASRTVDRAIEGRRAAYQEEVTRLIQASFKLIRETGNLEPKVSEIVAEAGLSNQIFYKHFRSKDELLLAVLDEGSQILKNYLAHRMVKVGSPEQKICQWVEGMLAQVLNEAAAHATRPFSLSRARLSDLFPAEVASLEAQLTSTLQVAIQQAIDSGDMPNADAIRDAEVINNMVTGWVERKMSAAKSPEKEEVDHLVDFVISGLKRKH